MRKIFVKQKNKLLRNVKWKDLKLKGDMLKSNKKPEKQPKRPQELKEPDLKEKKD